MIQELAIASQNTDENALEAEIEVVRSKYSSQIEENPYLKEMLLNGNDTE